MDNILTKNFSISNELIVARHGLDISEWGLLATTLSKLDQRKEVKAGTEFSITVEDYATIRNISIDWAVRQLKAAAFSLTNKTYMTYNNGWESAVNFVVSADYEIETGLLKIIFTEPFMQKLFALESRFTILEAQELNKLSSNYAWRLYTILKGYKYKAKTGTYTVDWNYLNDMFCCDYREYKRFKEDLLLPSISLINKAYDIEVTLVEKRRRNVSMITFNYKFGKEARLVV